MGKLDEIRIFIASPGDLKEERDSIEEVVRRLNSDPLIRDRGIVLRADRWENVFPQAGRAQGIINEYVRKCDIFIGMLHRRFGAPTGKEESGTYEEFKIAYESWEKDNVPQIMFYFKTVGNLSLRDLKDEQLIKVLEFKDMIETKSFLLAGKFSTPEEFERKIEQDIKEAINKWDRDKITTQLPEEKPEKPTDISAYLNWIQVRCGQMDLQQLASEPIIVGLPELFVPLYGDDPDQMKEKQGRVVHDPNDTEYKKNEPVDIEILAERNSYLLIEGDPGCGKTTLLKQIALKMSKNNTTTDFHLPVLVFLRDCITQFKENGKQKFSAETILETYFKHHGNMLSCDVVKEYCTSKRVLFLIDGLDEVPESARSGIIEAFAEFRLKYDVRMVLAGRKHGIVGEAMRWFGEKHVKVLPFNFDQIDLFVKKWCDHIYVKRGNEGKKTADELINELQSHSAVKALIENPLLLATVCILYYEGEQLPEQRAELYRKFVENLIKRRFDDPDRILEVLKGLAFTMQESGEKGIGRNDALAIMKLTYRQNKDESIQDYNRRINTLFDEFEPHCGLIRLDNGHYRFWHLTFQEYLAAEYLIASRGDLIGAIEPYLTHDQFKETVRLYIGCLSLNMKMVAATIIRNVLQRDNASIDELILVGEALADIKKERRDESLVGEIQQRYWREINSGRIQRNKKAALGEIIGWVGDERDLCEFVEIKDGVYDLEDLGEHDIKPFAIGKYPVINRWYSEFINANGYKSRDYWSDEGWKWRVKNNILQPEFWDDRKWNCPNLPVVGVSCYETEAFVNWLNSTEYKGHSTYRLPTEEQWQAAAAGLEKRTYPWGEEFDAEKCNCREDKDKETRIGKTSSVGVLPAGNTPEGISDMAGNVWEWTSSQMGSYRVLRGGSWNDDAGCCRCAFRLRFAPVYCFVNFGFRVVFVP